MFGSLRKKLEEAVAQVNVFDGGKTAATVRAARQAKAPPAQTVSRPQNPVQRAFKAGNDLSDRYRDFVLPKSFAPTRAVRENAGATFDMVKQAPSNIYNSTAGKTVRAGVNLTPLAAGNITGNQAVADRARQSIKSNLAGASKELNERALPAFNEAIKSGQIYNEVGLPMKGRVPIKPSPLSPIAQAKPSAKLQPPLKINNPMGAKTEGLRINNPMGAKTTGLVVNNPGNATVAPIKINNPTGAKYVGSDDLRVNVAPGLDSGRPLQVNKAPGLQLQPPLRGAALQANLGKVQAPGIVQRVKSKITPLNEGGFAQAPKLPERIQRWASRNVEPENTAFADMQRGLASQDAIPGASRSATSSADIPATPVGTVAQDRVAQLQQGRLLDASQAQPTKLKVKGAMSDADYMKRYGKERGGKNVKVKPFTADDYAFDRWTDRSALGLGRETLERNIDRVAGKDAPKIKQFLVDASRQNETGRANFLTAKRNEVKDYVVKGLGIKQGSKASELTQMYGEGLITKDQLIERAGRKAPQIEEAASYFRKQYDDLLDQWNVVRRKHGYQEVPKRQDYFRHFKEINDGIAQLGIIKNARDLPTNISGITDIFRPNKPFSNAELRRYGNETDFDAVGGFDNYLDSVSKQIFHTNTVQRGRTIENMIRKQSEADPDIQLPNFVANLGEWTNLVSGKKSRIDRAAEQLLGRKVYAATNWLRSRTGANMVGANLASAASNFIPFTQSLATTAKPSAIRGISDTLLSAMKGNLRDIDGVTSSFLTRRFAKETIQNSGVRRASEIASAPFKLVDEFTSRSIVAGKYFENRAKGMGAKEAMKAADDYASKTITDRSLGQLPNLIETRTAGFLTQFQAEVNNQVSFLMRDIPQMKGGNPAKVASALTQFVVFSYLFNSAYEQVLGRRPQIDPIQAGLDFFNSLSEDDGDSKIKNVMQGLSQVGERIGTGLPFVSAITGGRLPVNSMLPDFKALGTGITSIGNDEGKPVGSQIYKGVSGLLYYGLPPFGGGQLRKTVEGLNTYIKGKSTTPAGNDRFEVAQTPRNLAQSAVFGQYTTEEGREYIKGLKSNASGVGTSNKNTPKEFGSYQKEWDRKGNELEKKFSKVDNYLRKLNNKQQEELISAGAVTRDQIDGLKSYEKQERIKLGLDKPETAKSPKKYYEEKQKALDEKIRKGNISEAKLLDEKKYVSGLKVKSDYEQNVVDAYELSQKQLWNYVSTDDNGKATYEKLLELDNKMVAAGFSPKLHDKYGRAKNISGTGSGGSGRGGKRAKINFKDIGGKRRSSYSSELQDILAQAKINFKKKA